MEAEILSNGGPLKVSLGCAECQDDKLKDSEMFLSGEGLFQYYENGAERVSAAWAAMDWGLSPSLLKVLFLFLPFWIPSLRKITYEPDCLHIILTFLYFPILHELINIVEMKQEGRRQGTTFERMTWPHVCVLICSVVSDSLRLHDCSPPGSSVHGIFQARVLEWVAISSSKGSSWPRIGLKTLVSPALAGGFFLPLCHLGSP